MTRLARATILGCLIVASASAQGRPDFSGKWAAEPAAVVPSAREAAVGPPRPPPRVDLGSGWGRTVTITQSVLMFAGRQVPAVKWRDWKLHYFFSPEPGTPATSARLFNLRSDPKEETDIKEFNPAVLSVMDKIVADFWASTQRYPNVPTGAKDPYVRQR